MELPGGPSDLQPTGCGPLKPQQLREQRTNQPPSKPAGGLTGGLRSMQSLPRRTGRSSERAVG